MMFGVSGPSASEGNGHADLSENGAGVLANLPRTRPQRATARRAAARSASRVTVERDAAKPSSKRPQRRPNEPSATTTVTAEKAAAPRATAKAKARTSGAGSSARRAGARPSRPTPIVDPAPRQGYECLEERATGSVQPPGGADLLNTAAEALSELAKAGLSSGERLLRDVLSLLPR